MKSKNMKKSIIQKTTGKGKAINEVQRPSTKKYRSSYDRIFGKKGAVDKSGMFK